MKRKVIILACICLLCGANALHVCAGKPKGKFVWPEKYSIPARDETLSAGCDTILTDLQTGDSLWLRKIHQPAWVYGEYDIQPTDGVVCIENHYDLDLEDLSGRLVVCCQRDADYLGVVSSTQGGMITIKTFTARTRQLDAALHIRQAALANGDTLQFVGRQTYFTSDRKIRKLRVFGTDGMFNCCVDYDYAGNLLSTIQAGDTAQFTEYYANGKVRTKMSFSTTAGLIRGQRNAPDGQTMDKTLPDRLMADEKGIYSFAYVTPGLTANGFANLNTGRLTYQYMTDWIRLKTANNFITLPTSEQVFLPIWFQLFSRDEDLEKYSPLTQYLKQMTPHWIGYYNELNDEPIQEACYAFVVNKKGDITDVRVLRSSGVQDFDEGVVRAITRMPLSRAGGIWQRKLGSDKENMTPHDYEVRFYIVPYKN